MTNYGVKCKTGKHVRLAPKGGHARRRRKRIISALRDKINEALGVLEETPDVDIDWNEEMQARAKAGIISAIEILLTKSEQKGRG